MKKVKLKHINLSNYKGIERFESDLSDITFIKGRNGIGKSTIADAIFDVLTDKMQDGSSTDNVRPHDENGKDIDHVDVIRSLTIEIDGVEYVLTKTTSQKWVRPRGCDNVEFQGNVTTYSINDFEKTKKEFTEFIEYSICKMDILTMVLNAQPFLNELKKSTAKARDLLTKLTGFSVERFIEENPQYVGINSLLRGETVENVLKKFRKDLSNQKKELETLQNNQAYEKQREIESFTEEATLKELTTEAEQLEADIEKKEKAFKKAVEKNQEYYKLKTDIREMESKAESDRLKFLMEFKNKISLKEYQISEAESKISKLADDVLYHESEIKRQKALLEQTEKEEIAFNENCPFCKQKLPEDKLKEVHEKALEGRNKEVQRIKEALVVFENALHGSEESRKKCELEIESLKAEKADLEASKEEAEKGGVDYPDGYKELCEKLNTVESYDIPSEPILEKAKLKEIREKISELEKKKSIFASERSRKAGLITQIGERIKVQAQACATIEKNIDMIQHFSIDKNIALAKTVNEHFTKFKFEFTDTTMEGNVFETLKLMYNGTSMFNGLNRGASIEVETDLIHGLQEMQNLQLPIVMDNTESLDEWRIPKYENQEIIIRRTDDDVLTITEGENG